MAAVWKNLEHPNIVPLLGVTTDPVQLVSGWMPDTDLTGYIRNHPDADRLSLVGVPSTVPRDVLTPSLVIRHCERRQLPALLQRHSRGSQGGTRSFLIGLPLTLTSTDQPNILVDATGHAMITDCGLAMVTQNLDSIRGAPDEYGGSTRWVAPEIFANRGTFSKEADIFSFAMITIEVRCGFRIDIWRI